MAWRVCFVLGSLAGLALVAGCGGDDDDAPPDAGPDPCALPDGDGDGVAAEACGGDDCDDARADVHPGAADTAGDGEDRDCDGDDGVDQDGDGHASISSGGDDCDDGHATIYPGAPENDWVTEVVDDGGLHAADAGTFPFLALDGEGNEHIAYQVNLTETPPSLYHASRGAGGLQLEAIDVDPDGRDVDRGAGWFGSLAADRITGALHVSYMASWGTEVRYATNAGGAWAIEIVQRISFPVADTSLALDPAGQPHIAYYDQRDTRIWYASVDDGGTWTSEPVSTEDDTGSESSLAIDGDGVAHIALRADAGALLYATNGSGAFEVEVLDDGGVGRSPSVALDSQGGLVVAYVTDAGVQLARGRSRDFSVETVEAGGAFFDTSLALDGQGVAHVAYYDDEDGGALRYATNPRGSWTLEAVEANGAGRNASIALDPDGQPRIAYRALGEDGSVLGFAHVEPDRIDTNCDGLDW